MNPKLFSYTNSHLHWDNINIQKLHPKIAQFLFKKYRYKGSYYLYNKQLLLQRLKKIQTTLPQASIFYSLKSLSNIHILKILQESNIGVDVVSAGEIYRALQSNFKPQNIIFAGVGKTKEELTYALEKNIHSFHVESISEIKQLVALHKETNQTKPIQIALRINPDISVNTHTYIQTAKKENKFGIDSDQIKDLISFLNKHKEAIQVIGLQIHLGSQLTDINPYLDSLKSLVALGQSLENDLKTKLQYISLGGGFAVDYEAVNYIDVKKEFNFEELNRNLNALQLPWKVVIEPGRYISALVGMIIANVTYIKPKAKKDIVIVDTGMSDFIRPALYQAKHPIVPLVKRDVQNKLYDIVGPVCESADFWMLNYKLPTLQENDTIAILHCGAYGACMSSHYNSRVKIPEILLLEDGTFKVISKPETFEDLIRNESEL